MSVIQEVAHFVRWRLVAVRYAGKLRRAAAPRAMPRAAKFAIVEQIERNGYAPAFSIPPEQLAQIVALYRPRVDGVKVRPSGHPFVNLVEPGDLEVTNPVVRLAFSKEVLDVAFDYFGGRMILDSIQVLYSWPTEGAPSDSQMWHKDYGDSRSFHWVAYLNDVQADDDGPFVFVDRADTARISRSPFIRRIDDQRFRAELGDGRIRQFTGNAGDSVFVDPAACYHFGSRCRRGRLAIFITFNTDRPFVEPTPLVSGHRSQLLECATRLRPDLSPGFLRSLLQLP